MEGEIPDSGRQSNEFDRRGYEEDDGGDQFPDSQEQQPSTNALNLQWVLGFNKDLFQGVHNLTTDERAEIFYSAAHTGVIYDYEAKT